MGSSWTLPTEERCSRCKPPQIFRAEILRAAHQTVEADVTDDASMVEVAGGLVATFEGAYENIKITTPSDIAIARTIAAGNGGEWKYRSGIGFDGHKLVDGGPPQSRGMRDRVRHAVARSLGRRRVVSRGGKRHPRRGRSRRSRRTVSFHRSQIRGRRQLDIHPRCHT